MTDRRLGSLIRKGIAGEIVLLGYPYDRGVSLNGGRPGAAGGPSAFRSYLEKTGSAENPERGISLESLAICDAGDVSPGLDLEASHEALKDKTLEILRAGGIPFSVGGGNDQSWPNADALLSHTDLARVGVVNIDAHLDVRPLKDGKAHSGSPFRLLLEDPRFDGRRFIEFSAQGGQCSREHADYVASKGANIFWLREVRKNRVEESFREVLGKLAWECDSIFVSFDLDSISGADAPGVSCPGSIGLSAWEALEIAWIAGNHPAVRLFDLSEYNPTVEKDRTGRLAASIFYHFCLGSAARKEVS